MQYSKGNKTPDHYKTLGIKESANEQDIKKAFKQLSREYHPDKIPKDASNAKKNKLNEKYMEIIDAYETLKDSDKRAEYDNVRKYGGNFGGGGGNQNQNYNNYNQQQQQQQYGNQYQNFQDGSRQYTYSSSSSGGQNQNFGGFNFGQGGAGGFEDMFSNFFSGGAGSGRSKGQNYQANFQQQGEDKQFKFNGFKRSKYIKQLNTEDESILTHDFPKRESVWIVLFYEQQQITPEIQKAYTFFAKEYFGIFNATAIECKTEKQLRICSKLGYKVMRKHQQAVPQIWIYSNDRNLFPLKSKVLQQFDSNQKKEFFSNFIFKEIQTLNEGSQPFKIQVVTEYQELEQLISKNSEFVKIILYTDAAVKQDQKNKLHAVLQHLWTQIRSGYFSGQQSTLPEDNFLQIIHIKDLSVLTKLINKAQFAENKKEFANQKIQLFVITQSLQDNKNLQMAQYSGPSIQENSKYNFKEKALYLRNFIEKQVQKHKENVGKLNIITNLTHISEICGRLNQKKICVLISENIKLDKQQVKEIGYMNQDQQKFIYILVSQQNLQKIAQLCLNNVPMNKNSQQIILINSKRNKFSLITYEENKGKLQDFLKEVQFNFANGDLKMEPLQDSLEKCLFS